MLPKVTGGPISDAAIRRRVLAEIDKQPWASRAIIDAAVRDGIVELCGVIQDEGIRAALRGVEESFTDIRGVHDDLVWVEA